MKDTVFEILKIIKVPLSEVGAIYPVGSQVYQTATKASDFDYFVILNQPQPLSQRYFFNNLNLTVFSQEHFKKLLLEQNILAIETLWVSALHGRAFPWHLEKNKFKAAVRVKAQNSFKKAKLRWQEDLKSSQKSLFHSLRILKFSEQILSQGRITDYTAANNFWEEIMLQSNWNSYWDHVFNELINKI